MSFTCIKNTMFISCGLKAKLLQLHLFSNKVVHSFQTLFENLEKIVFEIHIYYLPRASNTRSKLWIILFLKICSYSNLSHSLSCKAWFQNPLSFLVLKTRINYCSPIKDEEFGYMTGNNHRR